VFEPAEAGNVVVGRECAQTGWPLGVVLSPGQRHDSTQLEPVLDAISVPRPGGRGRPRKRPDHLIADMVVIASLRIWLYP
jgi:hypothetical protein